MSIRKDKKKADYPKLNTMAKFIVLLFDGFHIMEKKKSRFLLLVVPPSPKVSPILYFLILKKLLGSA